MKICPEQSEDGFNRRVQFREQVIDRINNINVHVKNVSVSAASHFIQMDLYNENPHLFVDGHT